MFKMPRQHLARAQILMGEKIISKNSESDQINAGIVSEDTWLSGLCYHANISKREYNKILSLVSIASFVILILAIFSRSMLLPAMILPSLIAIFRLCRRAFKRAENFERDYPAFLLSLASSVRTGLDPLSAMIESEKLFEQESEIRKELYKFKLAIERGKPEQEAVREFGASIRHPDIQLFRTGYLLARKEGSSFAECLQRLAKVTRQRQSFRRKVRSAVAMQRVSAFGIGGCAILICIIQTCGNPKILTDALAHPLGQRLLVSGALLIISGLVWMIRMTKSNI